MPRRENVDCLRALHGDDFMRPLPYELAVAGARAAGAAIIRAAFVETTEHPDGARWNLVVVTDSTLAVLTCTGGQAWQTSYQRPPGSPPEPGPFGEAPEVTGLVLPRSRLQSAELLYLRVDPPLITEVADEAAMWRLQFEGHVVDLPPSRRHPGLVGASTLDTVFDELMGAGDRT